MIAGSLFSGIGGLEYGLHRSGLVSETAWMVEMDDFCCSVLENNFPETMILNKKIEDVNPKYLPKIDILTAGFPCQPVSVAGARKGVNDERWLWDEVWRFIDVLRPRYFILENVPGLLTANKGKAFERVIKDISESRLYRFEWQIVSARSIGAPHLRKRFFGVGELADTIDSRQRTQKFEFEREGQKSSQKWGRGQILESSRQSSSSDLGNAEHNGSLTTEIRGGVGECPVQRGQGEKIKKEVDRKPEGEFTTSRQEAELWMGNTAYGFPRWMAKLGVVNVWQHTLENFPTAAARDHKDTYGTVLTGSKTGDRNTLPLNIFRKLRDQIKDFAMWEYNMPRSIEDYPDRVNKLKALGNAVVPQCAELVGRLILNSIGTDKLIFCDSIKEDHPQ